MEATVVLVLLFTLVVGGMMLALVMGYRDIEERRAQKAVLRPAKAPRPSVAAMIPGFFAKAPKPKPAQPVLDVALLARLEQHVKAEHARVAEFVHYPSIENLYRKSDSSLHVH